MNMHRYRVDFIPTGCEEYMLNDYIELAVPEPPPQTIVWQSYGDCSGITFVLEDPT